MKTLIPTPEASYWWLSHRADRRILPLADRHYNRQKPGTPQFVPPGQCLVLRTKKNDAVWVSSWPFSEYTKHEWAGAWVNTTFRNESSIISSKLITEALAVTRFYWNPPTMGMVSFVDSQEVSGIIRRGKPVYGYCYLKAGWSHVGFTKGGLWVWQITPSEIPLPKRPCGPVGFGWYLPRDQTKR
jgi:hypothetical protein